MRPQRLDEAEAFLRKSLELNPSNTYSRLYLGHSYYDRGAYKIAKDHFLLVEKADLPEFLQMKVDEMILCSDLRDSASIRGSHREIQDFFKEYAPQNYY